MTPRALHILAVITLMLATGSASARSVREVLGEELNRMHPGVDVLYLNHKEINDLDGLSEVGRRYPDLRLLHLNNNQIQEIPGGTFIGFSNLVGLYLSNNAITNLSDGVHVITPAFMRAKAEGRGPLVSSFAGLTALQILQLDSNKLTSLPESFGGLTGLQQLWLGLNKLSSLPESFSSLSALEDLFLSANELTSLPESFGRLTALQSLYLHENELSSLPESFGDLIALDFLNLKRNALSSLPESFGDLTALEVLNLNENKLSSLPESFGGLTVLERLYLNENELRSLPESFGGLAALQKLELDDNRLGETYNGLGYEGWDPVQFFSTLVTRFMNRVTPLDKLLGGLPLWRVNLRGNKLDSQVINSMKTALPNAQVRDESLS